MSRLYQAIKTMDRFRIIRSKNRYIYASSVSRAFIDVKLFEGDGKVAFA